MKELNFDTPLDVPQMLVFTPFQEDLTQWLLGQISSAHVYDGSNPALAKKLNVLTDDELFFLFSQTKTSIFTHIDRMSSFIRIVEVFCRHENELQLFALSQSKNYTQRLGKATSLNIFSYSLPSFSTLLQRFGIFKSGQCLPKWLVHGMTLLDNPAFNFKNAAWLIKSKNQRINKPESMEKALVFLANHSHKTHGYNEIGSWCGIDNETAQRYVEMLKDYGVVFPLMSFSSRKRYEYIKGFRAAFLDNGTLNWYRNNFLEIDKRTDALDLWKNWVIAEKIKKDSSELKKNQYFFWQSHTRQNIDLIVLTETGEKQAFIMVWNAKRAIKAPPLFAKYYPDIPVQVINPSNYLTMLSQ